MTNALKPHELSEFYPMHDPARFADLVEGMKKSGYRDEFPIVVYEGKILDGRNRYNAALEAGVEPYVVQFSGDDPVEFVMQANSNRRDLEPGQRVAIHMNIRKKYPKTNFQYQEHLSPVINARNSQKEFAKQVGVSTGTVANVEFVEKYAPVLFEKVATGEMPAKTAYKKAKKLRTFEQHAALVELAKTIKPSERWNVFTGDIKTVELEPASLDAIITDPPYPKEYLPLWSDLSLFSSKYLKPGGVLLAMSGQIYLPEVMQRLGENLTYQWIMSCNLPGGGGNAIAAGVRNILWKPILIYRNGGDNPVNVGSDLFKNDKPDKDFHEWGQGVGGYLWQIENFTRPNDLVCDPFLGGGTTAIAALKLNRRFVGFDCDAEKVSITKGRLVNV
jgi:hypothetical protein